MGTITNHAGRELPEAIPGYGAVKPFAGAFGTPPPPNGGASLNRGFFTPGSSKRCATLEEALEKAGLADGLTLSFHHHLREGDKIVNRTLDTARRMGARDLVLAPSALFGVHEPLARHIREGTIRRIEGSMNGPVGRLTSVGGMKDTAVLRSHGGRVRAIRAGDLPIDIAVIAAPTADEYGNANGINGPNACGPLAYSHADALFARKVIVVTDNLVPYPAVPLSIPQHHVDVVVEVDSIGNNEKIVSGTTRVTTREPGLTIARTAAEVIYRSGLMKDGFNFQAGAGGISLATVKFMGDTMERERIRAAWVNGGTTEIVLDLFRKGLIDKITTCQAFDLPAVESMRTDAHHIETNMDFYANIHNKGCICHQLDCVVLGATEVDVNFNVNVNTHSDGYLLHGIGGHQDTASGARLTVITAPLARKNNAIIRDRVTTVTTPGECIDVVVTDGGIAVNPRREEVRDALLQSGLPVRPIEELRDKANVAAQAAGTPPPPPALDDRIVALIEWRDGTVLDVVRRVKADG